jgi:hypothetical protein
VHPAAALDNLGQAASCVRSQSIAKLKTDFKYGHSTSKMFLISNNSSLFLLITLYCFWSMAHRGPVRCPAALDDLGQAASKQRLHAHKWLPIARCAGKHDGACGNEIICTGITGIGISIRSGDAITKLQQ